MNSFVDSASTTSIKSGDTEEQHSMATSNTAIEFGTHTTFRNDCGLSIQIDHNSELVQNILRKFHLQRSDYMFLENILRVLERERQQRIG